MKEPRHVLAVVVSVLVVAAILFLGGRANDKGATSSDEPGEALWALFRAQKEGDTDAYLDQLTGKARAGAEQASRELGAAAFADYLRGQDKQIKGIAIKGREQAEDGAVTLLVDLVYADGQEEHRFVVKRDGGRWRIAELLGKGRHPSPIPYGTPVAPLDAEEPDTKEDRQ